MNGSTEWYEALLAEMRIEQIEARRNRINPRVIKRKMSKWNVPDCRFPGKLCR